MPASPDERADQLAALLAAVWAHPVGPEDGGEPGNGGLPGVGAGSGLGAGSTVGAGRFEAESPEWWESDRVFGGMVVAQAVGAALQTVDPDLLPHSFHGYFLRPTRPGERTMLRVSAGRDGRSFSVRHVVSEVDARPVFTMTGSFHRPEPGDEYQLSMPEVPGPETVAPADLPVPLDVRELGPTPRRVDGTYEATRRVWVRTAGPVPDDPQLHTCLLAYLSDMTGASFRPHSLGTWGGHTDASLDHALWFHRPARVDRWLLFDLQALVNASGRATVRGVLFDEEGHLCASMAQELLIRALPEPETSETSETTETSVAPSPSPTPAVARTTPAKGDEIQDDLLVGHSLQVAGRRGQVETRAAGSEGQ